jgi:hypothetical protein
MISYKEMRSNPTDGPSIYLIFFSSHPFSFTKSQQHRSFQLSISYLSLSLLEIQRKLKPVSLRGKIINIVLPR